jgi:hypothetical protein
MGFDLPGKSDVFLGCRSWNSASPSAVKWRRVRSSLKRSYALPTTGIGGHETEIIGQDLSREPGIAFVAIDIFRCACVALGKGLKFKLRELDTSGGDRLTLADTEVKSPDGQRVLVAGVSERSTSRQPRGYLLPRTAPQTILLHAPAECLRVFSDGALHVNTVREPVLIAVDFVVRQHRPLVFQDSDGRQQPAFGSVPERTIVRAIHREIFSEQPRFRSSATRIQSQKTTDHRVHQTSHFDSRAVITTHHTFLLPLV